MRNWKTGIPFSLALAAMLLGGCATGNGQAKSAQAPEIKEEWLARVPRQDLGQVQEAQSARRIAEDERNRTQVELADARNDRDVIKAQVEGAKAQKDAAERSVEAARETGDQQAITEAQNNLDGAELRARAAEQRLKVAEARIDAAEARNELAQARVETAQTRVKQAEYQALRAHGDTRVQDIDPVQFESALADRRARESELERKLSDEENKILTAQQELQQLQQQLQAREPAQSPAG